MKKRKAFTLVELLVAITIIAVLASSVTLTPTVGKQTAKREAERIAAYLIALTHEFGTKRKNFELNFDNGRLPRGTNFSVESGYREPIRYFQLKNGCSFIFALSAEQHRLTYIPQKNNFDHQGGHITITDSKGDTYKVIISLEGRIITSKN